MPKKPGTNIAVDWFDHNGRLTAAITEENGTKIEDPAILMQVNKNLIVNEEFKQRFMDTVTPLLAEAIGVLAGIGKAEVVAENPNSTLYKEDDSKTWQ